MIANYQSTQGYFLNPRGSSSDVKDKDIPLNQSRCSLAVHGDNDKKSARLSDNVRKKS